jgi:hypothetical protein
MKKLSAQPLAINKTAFNLHDHLWTISYEL